MENEKSSLRSSWTKYDGKIKIRETFRRRRRSVEPFNYHAKKRPHLLHFWGRFASSSACSTISSGCCRYGPSEIPHSRFTFDPLDFALSWPVVNDFNDEARMIIPSFLFSKLHFKTSQNSSFVQILFGSPLLLKIEIVSILYIKTLQIGSCR